MLETRIEKLLSSSFLASFGSRLESGLGLGIRGWFESTPLRRSRQEVVSSSQTRTAYRSKDPRGQVVGRAREFLDTGISCFEEMRASACGILFFPFIRWLCTQPLSRTDRSLSIPYAGRCVMLCKNVMYRSRPASMCASAVTYRSYAADYDVDTYRSYRSRA